MSTQSIAADVIREAASSTDATPSVPETSNAADYPQHALAEATALSADDSQNRTRRYAAAMTSFFDKRPFVSTKGGQVRRQFNDDGNQTRRVAREMVDLDEWAKDVAFDPRDKAALLANDFAKANGLPASNAERGSEEWRGSSDAIVDEIIRRGRESR